MQMNCWLLNLQLTRAWRTARSEPVKKWPTIVIELKDRAGLSGVGESAMTQSVRAFLQKVQASQLSFADVAGSMKYLDKIAPGNAPAKCALNIALLDGAAKTAKKPVYDFLGLGFRERKHITSFSIGIDAPEHISEKVRAAECYPVLKLKVGGADDRRIFAALREVAPDKPVRVDANEAWKTKEEALRNIEWLYRQGHVQFVEQPMPATTSARDCAWLKERSPLPIYGDESYHHASDCPLAAECFHGVNVKLLKAGGIDGALDALRAARKAGLKTMIGCMIESSILITAAAHLAELADNLDIDGNLLIDNDPYVGATAENGIVSFARAPEMFGLRVSRRGAALKEQMPLRFGRSARLCFVLGWSLWRRGR
jgi:L-alanine-DL-glutamate epimerase-like enolase superfamily enzyme